MQLKKFNSDSLTYSVRVFVEKSKETKEAKDIELKQDDLTKEIEVNIKIINDNSIT